MSKIPPTKLREWQQRAAAKKAIVPHFFEVWPTRVLIVCGQCRTEYRRTLLTNLDEPVFVCPNRKCQARNWVPVTFDLQ